MPEIEILLYRKGRSKPFSDWLASLRDVRAVGIVRARLNRIRLGNFGDCKPVGGGVEELRIDFGPGYRVYFGRKGPVGVSECQNRRLRPSLIGRACWSL